MSFDYSDFDTMAKELISEYGITATLKRISTTGEFNPVITSVDVSVKLVVSKFKNFDIDNSLILATDLLFIVDSAEEIVKSDKIEVGGKLYDIENVVVVKPGSTVLLYKVQARL